MCLNLGPRRHVMSELLSYAGLEVHGWACGTPHHVHGLMGVAALAVLLPFACGLLSKQPELVIVDDNDDDCHAALGCTSCFVMLQTYASIPGMNCRQSLSTPLTRNMCH